MLSKRKQLWQRKLDPNPKAVNRAKKKFILKKSFMLRTTTDQETVTEVYIPSMNFLDI